MFRRNRGLEAFFLKLKIKTAWFWEWQKVSSNERLLTKSKGLGSIHASSSERLILRKSTACWKRTVTFKLTLEYDIGTEIKGYRSLLEWKIHVDATVKGRAMNKRLKFAHAWELLRNLGSRQENPRQRTQQSISVCILSELFSLIITKHRSISPSFDFRITVAALVTKIIGEPWLARRHCWTSKAKILIDFTEKLAPATWHLQNWWLEIGLWPIWKEPVTGL